MANPTRIITGAVAALTIISNTFYTPPGGFRLMLDYFSCALMAVEAAGDAALISIDGNLFIQLTPTTSSFALSFSKAIPCTISITGITTVAAATLRWNLVGNTQ